MEEKDDIFNELFNREPAAPVQQNKKANIFKILYPAICVLIAAVFMFSGVVIGLNYGNNVSPEDYDFLQKSKSLQRVIDYVKTNYYLDIDDKTLIEYACMGVVNNLDPYSYLAQISNEESMDEKLGITINNSVKGKFRIVWVDSRSDAYKKGLKIGDYITAVSYNGTDYYEVEGLYLEEFSLYVSLLDKINKINKNIYFKTKRDGVELAPVSVIKTPYISDYVQYIDDFNATFGFSGGSDVAYLKLTTFYNYVEKYTGQSFLEPQIEDAMNKFIAAQGAGTKKKLIIDLRGNTGGSPEVMAMLGNYVMKSSDGKSEIPMIKHIFSNGQSATYDTWAHYKRNEEEKKKGYKYLRNDTPEYKYLYKDTDYEYKFIVLVDGMSASASEAMVGAMIVSGTIELIGSNTYGKGIGQSSTYREEGFFGTRFNVIAVTTGYYSFLGDVSVYVRNAKGEFVTGPVYNIHGLGFTPKSEYDFTVRKDDYTKMIQRLNEPEFNILSEDPVFLKAIEYFVTD